MSQSRADLILIELTNEDIRELVALGLETKEGIKVERVNLSSTNCRGFVTATAETSLLSSGNQNET